MDIKFGALINVSGTYGSVASLGSMVMLTLNVKGKQATISMTKAEAEQMRAGLAAALK